MIDVKDLPGSNLDPNGLLGAAVNWFLIIIAITAFFSIIYSGFQYITAGGDAAKSEKARKNILWAIIGIILASASLLLVRLVAGLNVPGQ
ncbi:MAG: hypothetical protein WEC83_00965 [Patescibacteria group bacterium]